MREKLQEIVKNGVGRLICRRTVVVTSVFIGIVTIDGKEHIVLEKRASGIKQGGEISLPGGKYDKEDKTTLETAIRECTEELGIDREKIEVVGKYGSLIAPTGAILDVYVGYFNVDSIDEFKFNKDEVERLLVVPVEFFMNTTPRMETLEVRNIPLFSIAELKIPSRYEESWLGQSRQLFFFNYDGEVIWGMTAEILIDFIDKYR